MQIAHHTGAYVIATASAGKHAWLRSLGADEVIDYARHDVTESLSANPVDVVLDLIGGRAALQSVAVTKPGGIVVEIPDGGYIDDLTRTAAADGALTPTISEIYELDDAAKAHHAIEGGHTQGKILLRPW